MHRSSLIGHIVELHHLVLSQPHPADATVRDFFRKRHYLGSHDRRYIQDALFGMIRNAILLREILAGISKYNFPKDSSLPTYVAYSLKVLHETPESILPAVRGLWSIFISSIPVEEFLSALMQSNPLLQYEGRPIQQLAIQESFPLSMVEEWVSRHGLEETVELCKALNSQAPITIRVNTLRCAREVCIKVLEQEGVRARETPFSPEGLILEKRVNIRALNAFRDGYFEMQDEGSQLVSFLTGAGPGMIVIDACAGGGGKTLHLANLMKNTGRLIAFHQDARQQTETQERAQRGGANIESHTISEDPGLYNGLKESADVVLVDAPCSGSGVFRRNPLGKLTYSTEMSEHFSQIQYGILDRDASLVKKGGRLVYATCTLLQKENESVVEKFLNLHRDFSLLPVDQQLFNLPSSQTPFTTLYPHKTNTDGFFVAVMSRASD